MRVYIDAPNDFVSLAASEFHSLHPGLAMVLGAVRRLTFLRYSSSHLSCQVSIYYPLMLNALVVQQKGFIRWYSGKSRQRRTSDYRLCLYAGVSLVPYAGLYASRMFHPIRRCE